MQIAVRIAPMERIIRTLTAASVALVLGSCSTTPGDNASQEDGAATWKATLGLSTSVPSSELAESLRLNNKVRVHGRAIDHVEGPAAEAGLRKGDVLLKLGDVDLYSADDIADFLSVSSPGARVPVAFKRQGDADVREAVVALGQAPAEASSESGLRWQFASLGQLSRALEVARRRKRRSWSGSPARRPDDPPPVSRVVHSRPSSMTRR